MITDLRNTDFVSFHIKPSITDETWDWIKTTLGLSTEAGTLTSDGFVSCIDLGFARVSNGSRYNRDLYPTIEDKTVQVPGGNGNYYFGSFWRDKDFSISISYDSMSEEQIRAITLIFAGDRTLWDIYFDEEPYKVWHVKITSPIQLQYICMDSESDDSDVNLVHNHTLTPSSTSTSTSTTSSTTRIYKGEGTISLKAYTPFAKERYKYLSSYTESNKNEWATASRLLSSQIYNNHIYDYYSGGSVDVYTAVSVEETVYYTYTPHTNLTEFESGTTYYILNASGAYEQIETEGETPDPTVTYYTRGWGATTYYIKDGDSYISTRTPTELPYDPTETYYEKTTITPYAGRYNLHNAGDVEADWETFITLPSDASTVTIRLYDGLDGSGSNIGTLVLTNIKLSTGDTRVRVSSKTNLIEGYNSSAATGIVYNKYKTSGEFFKIPRGDSCIVITTSGTVTAFNYDFKYL